MGKITDKNDFWFIQKNPITKVGVFPYLGKQISSDCEPNKIYWVLRPKEELFKKETLDSLKLIPLVNEHEMLGKDCTPAEEKGIEGILGENVSHNDDTIFSDIKIFSEDMKEKIKGGKKELSLGYWCDYEKQSGTYNGQRYDYIQKNIIGNHLALVDKGRMGSDVRVYDKAEDKKVYTYDALSDIDIEKMEYKKTEEEEKKMADEKKKVATIDEDKRKLIDEIGGMCKEAGMSEEKIKTIIGKAEKIAYNPSEEGKGTDEDENKDTKKKEEGKDGEENKATKDKCGKDEDGKEDGKEGKKDGEDEDDKDDKDEDKNKEKKGMDADFVKEFADKERFGKRVEEVVGTFDHLEMSKKEIAKYACDKLGIEAKDGNEVSLVEGYIQGCKKSGKEVKMKKVEDKSIDGAEDASLKRYLDNAEK